MRSHTIPGGIQPWPQAAYFIWVGDNCLPKKIQVGSRSLHVCHALSGCDVSVGRVVSGMSGSASSFFSRPCWRVSPLSHRDLSLRAHGKKMVKVWGQQGTRWLHRASLQHHPVPLPPLDTVATSTQPAVAWCVTKGPVTHGHIPSHSAHRHKGPWHTMPPALGPPPAQPAALQWGSSGGAL